MGLPKCSSFVDVRGRQQEPFAQVRRPARRAVVLLFPGTLEIVKRG